MTLDPDVRTSVPTEGPAAVVGRSSTHRDFREKVRGSLLYADDWSLPGMLHGRIVRSVVPSARITAIDTSAAMSVPGVRAVMTAADVPRNIVAEEVTGLGLAAAVQPVLAVDIVRYQGEPLVLIAADTATAAEEAAEQVMVEYEDVLGVYDVEEALLDGAPPVHPAGNRLVEWRIGRGDPEGAFAEAAAVVEGVYRTQHVDHAYLEPEAGVGWIDGDDVLTLRVSTQVIEHAREIAAILQVPHNKVRVMGTYMGGGFGGKEDMTIEPFLALLVWKTRRPVKMVWSRQESIQARYKRHPFTMHYRTGADAQGRLVAQSIRILGDAGAYPLLSPRILFAGAVVANGPYRIPNTSVEATAVFTNNVPTSAMRGFGAMQVVFAYESQMDRLADALGLSRDEIRRRNFLRRGDPLPTDEPIDTDVAADATLEAALDRMGPVHPGNGGLVGRGFACNMQPYGRTVFFSDRASCWIGLEEDGSLVVRTGATDLGGGQAASLAQIAGEILGIHPDGVTVYLADSALTPLAGGTFATRQLYMSGNAVLQAAQELRDLLAPVAAELLGTHAGDIRFGEGRAFLDGDPTRFVSLAELAEACGTQGVSPSRLSVFQAERGEFDPRTGKGRTFPDYTYGTHAVDVEVDPQTGVVTLLRYVACHDVGRAINPQRVEGQIQGGAVQGIGYALSEQIALVDGSVTSTLFADYLIPSASSVPDIEAVALEIAPGKGPFGARGIGEPPIAPSAAAIANAIADATGVRLFSLPMTPEKVLEALASPDPA